MSLLVTSDTITVQKDDNVLTFGHSNLVTYKKLDITVLKNNITSVEHAFSSVHVSSRTSSSTSYCCTIQLHSLSVSQYILVAAVKTKPNKFQIQFITNVRVFPVLCSVYSIFPFSRLSNFVTNPMVHGLL
jgi:hypothetical protein